MNTQDFTFSFTSPKSAAAIFNLLLDIDQWWSGLYAENIQGKSQELHDEFSFHAGGGVHYSKQKLMELIPERKIVWLVTESKLASFNDPEEWTNTKIGFDLAPEGDQTRVTFTHEGLIPKFECYGSCSGAWTGYLEKLAERLS